MDSLRSVSLLAFKLLLTVLLLFVLVSRYLICLGRFVFQTSSLPLSMLATESRPKEYGSGVVILSDGESDDNVNGGNSAQGQPKDYYTGNQTKECPVCADARTKARASLGEPEYADTAWQDQPSIPAAD
jgi:hypothetical protein